VLFRDAGDIETAVHMCVAAVKIFDLCRDNVTLREALCELAWLARLQGRFESAINYMLRAGEVAEQMPPTIQACQCIELGDLAVEASRPDLAEAAKV
jgi:hypothetical protein